MIYDGEQSGEPEREEPGAGYTWDSVAEAVLTHDADAEHAAWPVSHEAN